MQEKLNWEVVENSMAKPPYKNSWCLVKGFIIQKGRRVSLTRMAFFNGSEMEGCEDMIIEVYAQLER